MAQLDGLVAVVTGGNGGIGLGMARALAEAGADVAIWGRNEDKNATALAELAATGVHAEAFVCDVGDARQIADTFERTVVAMGRIDSFFANAGDSNPTPFLELDLEEWRRIMRVNLDSVFLCFQLAARHMIERGEGGSLIGVSSTSSLHGAANNEAYGTSKTAILGLVRALAVGLARHRIRVNALVPGWTRTELARGAWENERFYEVTVRRTPARRYADPAEMGPPAVFLADPALTFHTGDSLVVDGGYTVF